MRCFLQDVKIASQCDKPGRELENSARYKAATKLSILLNVHDLVGSRKTPGSFSCRLGKTTQDCEQCAKGPVQELKD